MLPKFSLKVELLVSLLALVALNSSALAAWQDEEAGATMQPASQPSAEAPQPKFLRVVEVKGKSVALEIASRTFTHSAGGPSITLVGVAHIGERSFFRALQKSLDQYEVVLYESVKPPGTGGAGGDNDEERIESTQAAMQFVGGLVEAYQRAHQSYPADLNALREFAAAEDARMANFLQVALIDAWGRPLRYECAAPLGPVASQPHSPPPYTLVSLGADGQAGGDGASADLRLADQPSPDAFALSKDDGLQSQLADALGLEFQLDALSYDNPNWRCSDMAMDEVSRRLASRGLDFELIGGTLAGSSLPAMVIKVVLGMIRFADTFLEGAIADSFKVLMIEMLGDETMVEKSMEQLGPGFGEVIINDRNQVVIDDLKAMMAREPQIKRVAVLYGAGHMPDLTERVIQQLGYAPAVIDDQPDEQWLTAIKVDYSKSAVSPLELERLRHTFKQMMKQQFRQAGSKRSDQP